MTVRKPSPTGSPPDKQLYRMVIISAVLHALLIIVLVVAASRGHSRSAAPVAYTVTLVDPAALGTNIPSGGGKTTAVRSPTGEKDATPVTQSPSQLRATAQEKKLATSIPQEQVKTAKAVKVKEEPEKMSATHQAKQPEPQKLATLPPSKKVVVKSEEKKPNPQQKEQEAEPEKVLPGQEAQSPKREKPQTPKATATLPPSAPARNVTEPVADLSADERDKRILAALERVRKQVQEKKEDGGMGGEGEHGVSGFGPPTLGGAPGEGGGGLVRGIEFIMYTEQVKRRVKENWIVTEKKPGLSAVVRFGVEADGKVFAVELVKPSGDRAFDESTLRAVRSASPLPPPPSAYLHEFATQKVEVAFGGEEHSN